MSLFVGVRSTQPPFACPKRLSVICVNVPSYSDGFYGPFSAACVKCHRQRFFSGVGFSVACVCACVCVPPESIQFGDGFLCGCGSIFDGMSCLAASIQLWKTHFLNACRCTVDCWCSCSHCCCCRLRLYWVVGEHCRPHVPQNRSTTTATKSIQTERRRVSKVIWMCPVAFNLNRSVSKFRLTSHFIMLHSNRFVYGVYDDPLKIHRRSRC